MLNQFLANSHPETEVIFLLTKVMVLAISARVSKFRHARRLVPIVKNFLVLERYNFTPNGEFLGK
jgi:hypothetical protein